VIVPPVGVLVKKPAPTEPPPTGSMKNAPNSSSLSDRTAADGIDEECAELVVVAQRLDEVEFEEHERVRGGDECSDGGVAEKRIIGEEHRANERVLFHERPVTRGADSHRRVGEEVVEVDGISGGGRRQHQHENR
jgi:hypothetical protein